MKNINEIHLEDIVYSLKTAHIKLDLEFLRKLLKNASGCDKPWRNIAFAEKIGCTVNKETQIATGINGWMNNHSNFNIFTLIRVVESSDYSWKEVEKHIVYIKSGRKRGEIKLKLPISIDNKIGSIIGHILGDGAINKRGESIFFCNSNPELLNEFITYMREIFGAEPRIWVQEPKEFHEKTRWLKRINNLEEIPPNHIVGLFYPKICVRIIKTIFGNFANGKEKRVTQEIKNSPIEFKKGLLRAFFDDEGSVNGNNFALRIHQDKAEILGDIKLFLKECSIESSEIHGYMRRDKKRHYLNITNCLEQLKFYKIIGCRSSNKRKEFEIMREKARISKKFKYHLEIQTWAET